MKTKHFFSLLALMLAVFSGCKKEKEKLSPEPETIQQFNFTGNAKLFFDFHNAQTVLGKEGVSGRSGETGELVMQAYHQLALSQMQTAFVDGVVGRIGYPLWTYSYVESNLEGNKHLILIPFTKLNGTRTEAYLIGNKDDSMPEAEIGFDIKLRYEIDRISGGITPSDGNTCMTTWKLTSFDNHIFNQIDENLRNLFCESCFETEYIPFDREESISVRSCSEMLITFCIDSDNITTGNPGGNGSGGDAGGWTFGSLPNGTDLPGGWGTILAGGFPAPPPPPPCKPMAFDDPGSNIDSREDDYYCLTHIAIVCIEGEWVQIIESIPCPECDGSITLEEHYAILCNENTFNFFQESGISKGEWASSGLNSGDYCNEGEFDADAALVDFLVVKLELDPAVDKPFLMDNTDLANGINSFYAATKAEFGEDGLESVMESTQLLLALEQAGLLNGPYDENFDDFIEDHIGSNPIVFAVAVSFEMASLKLEHPDWPDWKISLYAYGNVFLEELHLTLDIAGLVPGAGEFFDLVNGGIYTLQGEYLEASLSFSSMIPIAGWFSTGTKWTVKVIPGSNIRLVWLKTATEVTFASNSALRSQLRRILKTPSGQQAHHLVPLEHVTSNSHPVVQSAAKGFGLSAWHPNELANGINLPLARHSGSHNAYNTPVLTELEEIFDNYNGNISPQDAITELTLLMDKIRTAIVNNPNTHINDLIF